MEVLMPDHDNHVRQIQEKVTGLSNALADLGSGTGVQELLRIIHFPGFTTVIDVAFITSILDDMTNRVRGLAKMEANLVAASRMIAEEGKKAA
jgi:hypothetical protein